MRLHATCILVEETGVLLRGPSGSGKSDLALRLIDRGAVLVADDQVLLRREGDRLLAEAPDILAGLLEVRGLGILKFPYRAAASVGLVIDLVAPAEMERMPQPDAVSLLDKSIPLYRFSAQEPAAPLKVRLAMQHAAGLIMASP
ncbi:MAG TPA: HPr kinase/phosphatase C-terminal domain-containing protein [Magnetospirillaceae bacterium]|nr:HPr kinase/phosphatase C-terminal domain-containing protein [Magnetospirillaceae bacterium]